MNTSNGVLRCVRIALLAGVLASLAAAAEQGQETPPPQQKFPPEQYERPPKRACVLGDQDLPGAAISATALQPTPGSYIVDHNDVIPLIGSASDQDLFLQLCECLINNESACYAPKLHDTVDPIGYAWSLNGRGILLGPGLGNANLYQPPDLNIGEKIDVEIRQDIGDNNANDPPTGIRYLISIERINRCEYKRDIQVAVLGDTAPPPDIFESACDCLPQATATWTKDPTAIDAAIIAPGWVEADKKYVVQAGGSDEDALPLFCSGGCGFDARSFPKPDELSYIWTADRGSYPDHGGGAAFTNAWGTTAIYQAPSAPGPERLYIDVKDSGLQGPDDPIRKKHDLTVYLIDLDIDSDDTREAKQDPQRDPERTQLEDDIEDHPCRDGKVLLVNNGDLDHDNVRNLVDGIDKWGNEGTDASTSFTPIMVYLPDPIDPDKAVARFVYSASDPDQITRSPRSDGGFDYTPAPGHLRLWSKDGEESRKRQSLADGGDYVAPIKEYRVRDHFPPSVGPRLWRFYVEGMDISPQPGDRRVVLEVDPDGPTGPVGWLRDAVRITVIRNELTLADTMAESMPGFITKTRPTIELEPIDTSGIDIEEGGLATIHIKGHVRDKIADIIPNGRADIDWLFHEGQRFSVTRDPAEPTSKQRPYAYKGKFEGDIQVLLEPGEAEFLLETSENVQGLKGQKIVRIEAATGSGGGQMQILAAGSFTPGPATTTGSTTTGSTTTTGTTGTGPSTTTRPPATEVSGCYRAYFGRVYDARGMQDDLHLVNGRDRLSPLELDASLGAPNYISVEPFIFVSQPARIDDDRIVVLDNGEDAEWTYDTTGNLWPIIDVDIDADSNNDDTIDDDDDDIEELPDGLKLPPNVDDDDGNGEPDADNDRIDNGDDDLKRIVLRRPEALAPNATAKAVVKKTGEGKLRLFLDDGGSGREILAPDEDESDDLWAELSQGDLTLLAEGVGQGDVRLELHLETNDTFCSDFIAARIPTFELEVGLDDPDLDYDGAETGESGWIDIPADHIAVDYEDLELIGAVNLFAHFYREDELDDDELIPDRNIKWEVTANPGNQGARTATLRDLNDPVSSFQDSLDNALVDNGYSVVQLNYTCPHPCTGGTAAGGDRWVFAGDTFQVRAIADTDDGRQLIKTMNIRIVPGDWYFTVSNPDGDYQPPNIRRMDDPTFETTFSDNHTALTLGPDAVTHVRVGLSDLYRNALEAGRTMFVFMHGTGRISNFDPSEDNPDPSDDLEVQVQPGGYISFDYTEKHFGVCPWQPDQTMEIGAHISITDGARIDSALQSMVFRADPIPPPLGPPIFEEVPQTITADFYTPDLYLRETREFRTRVTRDRNGTRVPVPNAVVAFTVMNGGMQPADGLVATDANGYARITVTAEGAEPGPIRVLAALGSEGLKLSPDQLRWVSSGPTELSTDTKVFAGNITQDKMMQVETLIEEGDIGPIGDGLLNIPVPAGSTYTIKGDPGKVYHIEVRDSQAWGAAARYPFDQVSASDTTREVIASRDAQVSGAVANVADKVEGLGSLQFGGTQSVTLPGSPAVNLPGGLVAAFWFKPDQLASAKLLDRFGQYQLTMQGPGEGSGAGYLRLTLNGLDPQDQTASAELESKIPAVADEWNYVELMYDGQRMRLSIGTEADRLETEYLALPSIRTVDASTPVLVGEGLVGHMDDLRFTKGGLAPPVAQAINLSPQGTVTADSQGMATVRVQSTGMLDPNDYRPVEIYIAATGSQTVTAQAHAMHDSTYAEAMGVMKAMLVGTEGLGKDPGWVEWGAAWLSEMVPFFADLRTLGFEFYKAASGCDSVSALNISFAVAGLVADIASFGTAGVAIRASKAVVKTAVRTFLKEFAQNSAMGALTHVSVATFTEFINKEFLRAECASQPDRPPDCNGRTSIAHWVSVHSENFMNSLSTWAQDATLNQTLDAALHSVDEMFLWFKFYREAGAAQMGVALRTIEEESQP